MSITARFTACAVLLALAAPGAAAQDDAATPLTWIAYSKVEPGKTRDAVELEMFSKDLVARLMEEGSILGWGIATPINHHPGDTWNHVEWVTLPGWDAVGTWADAVTAAMMAMDPAEAERRRKLAAEIYVEGSHHDHVVRHFMASLLDGETKPAYLYLSYFDARPGQDEAMVSMMKELVTPVGEQLKRDGALLAFGGYGHELHGAPDATSHAMWYFLPDLGAVDTMHGTFMKTFDAGDRARLAQIVDMSSHSDRILMILHFEDAGLD